MVIGVTEDGFAHILAAGPRSRPYGAMLAGEINRRMEMCGCPGEPVEFRNRRSGAKGFEERQRAGFKLLSTSRRITSMLFHVELFQTDIFQVLVCADFPSFGIVILDVDIVHDRFVESDLAVCGGFHFIHFIITYVQ